MHYLCSRNRLDTVDHLLTNTFLTMVTKKKYEKPSVRKVELEENPALLAGSFSGSRGVPYGDPTEY